MELKPSYKLTELGAVPREWEVKPLADVVDFLDGRRRPIKDSNRAKMRGSIPYYGASGVVDYVNDYIFEEDLILLGEDGENILSRRTRLAFKISGKAWVNNHAHVLRPRTGMVLDYLVEFLESRDYEQYNTGTAQPKLNKLVCSGIAVLCPPVPEQRAIAAALSDVDVLIASLDRLIAKKRDLKRAAMQQLLTGQTRLPGFHGEWEVKRLGELFEITSSKRVFQSEWKPEGIPFYRARELAVLGEIGRVDNELFITKSLYKAFKTAHGVPEAGDMLVTGVGTLGKVYVVTGDHDFYFKDGNIIWFKIRGSVSPEFLRQLYLTKVVMKQITDAAAGTTVGTYTISGAKKTKIPFPCLPEQTAIAAVLSDMDAEIAALERRREKTRLLKQGMMQELLTGKTRLV